jgi:hypothetical protein
LLEAEIEEQQDQPEDRDEREMAGGEAQGEPAGVRARHEPDEHVHGNRRQADELAEPPEDVGDQEESPQNRELPAQSHG